MAKIDNIISIIMVFITAIGISRARDLNPGLTVFVVICAFVLYELILNAANNNPSIRTVLYVTGGFVFGLSLAVIIDFDRSWLSAFICLLCMGYKYMVAEATVKRRSSSRNIFVIVVNAFFYASMFTVVECLLFSEGGILFVMIYVASFAFFMCSYIAYKSKGPGKKQYIYGSDSAGQGRDMDGDWKHIIKRSVNYGKQLREQFDDALDKSGDTFSGLVKELRKKIIPDYSDRREENEGIRAELDRYRQMLNEIVGREDLNDNELEILERINSEFDSVSFDFYREGSKPYLEYETRITGIAGDIEMLKNTIKVRKEREAEDKESEKRQNRRSQAQQARRKREREEREKREQEEKRAKEEREAEDTAEEERSAEEERRRREEEHRRQEKRRRERNRRTSYDDAKKEEKDNSRVAGIETKYFKGCATVDDLSLRYKKLCLIYHPDSGSGDVDTYIELKDEYELLKKRLS